MTFLGVRNIGGNVAEFVADSFASYVDDVCWGAAATLHTDPRCDADTDHQSIRGGSYAGSPNESVVRTRSSGPKNANIFAAGVRCAISM